MSPTAATFDHPRTVPVVDKNPDPNWRLRNCLRSRPASGCAALGEGWRLRMTYFDTACIVKCYVKEEGLQRLQEFVRDRERIACSIYGRLELHAALHR